MKNNTKLIMETWRRFLSEGPQEDPGQTHDPDLPEPTGEEVPYDEDLVSDIERIDAESSGETGMEMNMPSEDFMDLPHAGDDIEYSEEDARMSPSERYDAQAERDELNDPTVDEFGNEQENPFAYDDGPYWKKLINEISKVLWKQ